jgi:hypothetical protein
VRAGASGMIALQQCRADGCCGQWLNELTTEKTAMTPRYPRMSGIRLAELYLD